MYIVEEKPRKRHIIHSCIVVVSAFKLRILGSIYGKVLQGKKAESILLICRVTNCYATMGEE